MEAIRVVFAELPLMLREILHATLSHEPDLELVGEVSSPAELSRLVSTGDVDVVIMGLTERDLPASQYQLFLADPRVRILAIEEYGRSASLYELRPHRTILGEGSPQDLARAIRQLIRCRSDLPQRSWVSQA